MLAEKELERICVVLVRARNPNNIGAVARAMHGFGFRHLRLVNEYPVPLREARSAVDASAVLAGAQEFAGVAEAVADCNLVIGTTAAGKRAQEHPLYTLAEAGGLAGAHLASSGENRVALLFGSEKTGLSNDELSHCNWLLTIPMHETAGERRPSMNLGQAAAVCLYELVRTEAAASSAALPDASAGDLERLTQLLAELLEESGYTQRHPANSDAVLLRRLVRRMGLDSGDAVMWTGILRQALWKIRGGSE
jgi:TrmH family RNA methyltransferase